MKRDMDAKKKIMDVLLDNIGGKSLYLSKIAELAGVPVSTAHQILEKLAREKTEKTYRFTTEVKWFKFVPPYTAKRRMAMERKEFLRIVDAELAKTRAMIIKEYEKGIR